MEASGGYEQDWAKALREARIDVAQPPDKITSSAQAASLRHR